MKSTNIYFLSIIFALFIVSCKAQNSSLKYSTKSAKAIKAYESAASYYDSYNNVDALKELKHI